MFAPFALLTFISNTTCKLNSTVPCLVSVTSLYFCTHFIYCALFPSLCLLAAPALGRRLLSWRCFDWATPSPRQHLALATPFSWRRLLLGDAFFLATPVAASNGKKIKTKNQGKVFLELIFSFIWVTSLKNPGKGKRASPLTRLLHCCLRKSAKIELQVGCIPTARDGATFQGL